MIIDVIWVALVVVAGSINGEFATDAYSSAFQTRDQCMQYMSEREVALKKVLANPDIHAYYIACTPIDVAAKPANE